MPALARRLGSALTIALVAGLGACGSQDAATTGGQAASTSTPSSTPSSTVRPAGPDDVVGGWVPDATSAPATPSGSTAQPRPAGLLIVADGSWQASDGCNTSRGRWTLTAQGRVDASRGVSTQLGCDNVDVGGWWSNAERAELDGDRLVLRDAGGAVLGRLARSPGLTLDSGPGMTHGPVTR